MSDNGGKVIFGITIAIAICGWLFLSSQEEKKEPKTKYIVNHQSNGLQTLLIVDPKTDGVKR
ncbi:hypothetical protein PROFUN_11038 [Planoprotostelium fungivorum]|uniref:Uncharacterized protein n=1 Tax=Planoprotostelium fungivorum TaxID=1890364 RepID=A0A2P6NBM5_9EUKA|nr:hypothetical protein PROFUN_11038 [Planoprotostelium fungivorum]